MPKKHTYEEVSKMISDNNCTLISEEYINTLTPLVIKCSCGDTFSKTLKIMKKSGLYMCNKCNLAYQSKKSTLNYSEVKNRVESQGHVLLTKEREYTNTKYKLDILCPLGHKYKKYLSDFDKGIRCNTCSGIHKSKNQRTDYSEVKAYIEDVGYTLLSDESEYMNMDSLLGIKCNKGHIYKASYGNFKGKDSRCPHCYDFRRGETCIVNYDTRKMYVESFGYTLLTSKEDYVDGKKKCEIRCNKGHEYKASMHEFKTGNRCPVCRKSKGEAKVKELLEKYNLSYNEQHKFDNCVFKRRLLFDFYLPKYNLAIEYDGRQHFEVSKAFGGLEGFIDVKIRDTIKNVFCEKNNINLLRIPYTDFKNIEEILIEKLKLL